MFIWAVGQMKKRYLKISPNWEMIVFCNELLVINSFPCFIDQIVYQLIKTFDE